MEQHWLDNEEVLFTLAKMDGNLEQRMIEREPQGFQANGITPIVWAVQWPT